MSNVSSMPSRTSMWRSACKLAGLESAVGPKPHTCLAGCHACHACWACCAVPVECSGINPTLSLPALCRMLAQRKREGKPMPKDMHELESTLGTWRQCEAPAPWHLLWYPLPNSMLHDRHAARLARCRTCMLRIACCSTCTLHSLRATCMLFELHAAAPPSPPPQLR